MFSCDDYDKLHALIDRVVVFFSFHVNCIYFVLFFEEYDCRYALQYTDENTTVIYCNITVLFIIR